MDESHTFFWLVGVMEGEAYFGYVRSKGPRLEVEMKDEHVVARVASIFGVAYQRRDRRHSKPSSSVTYRCTLGGVRALRIMKRLQPYMSPRRQRAIQLVEDTYKERHTNALLMYERVPLPSLLDLPYIVERG